MPSSRNIGFRPRSWLCLLILFCCLAPLTACAAQGEQRRQGELELRQLETNAVLFINALYAKETDKVMSLSGFPFYLNHQAVLDQPPEWLDVLDGFFAKAPVTPVQVLEIQPMSAKQMEMEHPEDLAKLMEHDFSDKQMLLLTLQTSPASGQGRVEKVLLLVDPFSGKVVGYII